MHGDVSDLTAILAERGIASVDHVISGLARPFFSARAAAIAFSTRSARVLRPEGTFSQITEIPWLYQGLYRRHFQEVRFVSRAAQPAAGRRLLLPAAAQWISTAGHPAT